MSWRDNSRMPRKYLLVAAGMLAIGWALPLGALPQGPGDIFGIQIGPFGGGLGQGPGGGVFVGPMRDGNQPTGTSVIRGRILTADTGAPVRRAQIRAVANELRAARLAS